MKTPAEGLRTSCDYKVSVGFHEGPGTGGTHWL